MEPLDDDGRDGVQGAGLLDDLHKDHCGGNDQNGVNIGEHTLDHVTQGDTLSTHQRTSDRREDHGNADGQLCQKAAQQEHGDHCDEGEKLSTHQDTSMVVLIGTAGVPAVLVYKIT